MFKHVQSNQKDEYMTLESVQKERMENLNLYIKSITNSKMGGKLPK